MTSSINLSTLKYVLILNNFSVDSKIVMMNKELKNQDH